MDLSEKCSRHVSCSGVLRGWEADEQYIYIAMLPKKRKISKPVIVEEVEDEGEPGRSAEGDT